VVLAEELNFTRTAHRLHITQSPLSKQIAEIETQHRFQLFTREKKRVVELTDAGRAFVEEARSALLHAERAVHGSRAAHHGFAPVLLIGHSPYADDTWISTLLAIRLPLYPKLRVRLGTQRNWFEHSFGGMYGSMSQASRWNCCSPLRASKERPSLFFDRGINRSDSISLDSCCSVFVTEKIKA